MRCKITPLFVAADSDQSKDILGIRRSIDMVNETSYELRNPSS